MGAFDFDIVRDALWWSPRDLRDLRRRPGDLRADARGVIELVHPDDRAAFIAPAAPRRSQRRLPFAVEFRIAAARRQRRLDRAPRPHRVRRRRPADAHFGITMDITDRKLAEQALRDADRKKDAFIATLAHELRNPLAPIRNAVSCCAMSPADDPQVTCAAATSSTARWRRCRTCSTTCSTSRAWRAASSSCASETLGARDRGRARGRDRPARDRRAGHALDDRRSGRAARSSTAICTRLAQVFSNLLINAAKYTPRARHDHA